MVLENSKTEVAKKQAEDAAKDPIVQQQQKENELKEMEIKRKTAKDAADADFKEKSLEQKNLIELARQASNERTFKVQGIKDSVQGQGERALAERAAVFEEQKHATSLGAKILDRMLQEETKRQAASKKGLQG
jgi:hypothetical protein